MSLVTSFMGLTVWDQSTDPYDHSQLANNFQAVDQHDHTAGKGRQIPTAGIQDSAITAAKILDGAITGNKLPDNSITGAKLGPNSVSSSHIVDGTIATADIANGAVTFGKLDPSVLPVGQIIMWYRPNPSIPLPTGWEILDGRAWAAVPNAWGVVTGTMPDFRNRFPLGAALSGVGSTPSDPPDVGQVGGAQARNLQHSHAVTSHTHTVGGHAHTISSDGSHKHRFSTTIWDGLGNPIGTTFTDGSQRGSAVPGSAGTREAFYVPDLNRNQYYGESVPAPMETTGAHTHGGATGASAPFETAGATAATDAQLSTSQDLRPAHVGVLFLIRVN